MRLVRDLSLLLAALACLARADVIVEGYHGVQHDILIEGAGAHAGWTFWYGPTHVGGAASRVEDAKPLRYYHLVSPRIVAQRAGEPDPPRDDARAWLDDPARPRSEMTFSHVGQRPDEDPLRRVREVWRITGVEGTRVNLERVSVERFDGDGKPLPPPAAEAASAAPAPASAAPDAPPAPPAPAASGGSVPPAAAALLAVAGVGAVGLGVLLVRRRGAAALLLALGLAAPARADLPPPGPLDGGGGTAAAVVVGLVVVAVVAGVALAVRARRARALPPGQEGTRSPGEEGA